MGISHDARWRWIRSVLFLVFGVGGEIGVRGGGNSAGFRGCANAGSVSILDNPQNIRKAKLSLDRAAAAILLLTRNHVGVSKPVHPLVIRL